MVLVTMESKIATDKHNKYISFILHNIHSNIIETCYYIHNYNLLNNQYIN